MAYYAVLYFRNGNFSLVFVFTTCLGEIPFLFYFKNVKKIQIKYVLLPIPFHNFGNHNFMNNISLSKKQYNIVF